MDVMIIPPPFPELLPEEHKRNMTYGKKCVFLGLQCVILMIGALIVYSLLYSREKTNKEVTLEIVREWGGSLYFDGILGVSPSVSNISVSPSEYNCEATVNTQSLHRGIYEAEVYNAEIKVSGWFDRTKLQENFGNRPALYLDIREFRVDKLNPVKVCGKEYNWTLLRDSLMVMLDNLSTMPEQVYFETSFSTRGSGGLYISQIGESNKVTFSGIAGSPSFQGESLPMVRSIMHDSFDATWESRGRSGINRGRCETYPSTSDYYNSDGKCVDEAVAPEDDTKYGDYVGADFLVGVDRYQKVARSLKYSFIIILLTYIVVLAVEMIRKKRIPLLNYFLIGVSLMIFYILLLSFAELVAFSIAYLIAAAMTISLISIYMGMSLNSRKIGVTIALILMAYYVACYIMLSSIYALLSGSLLLFIAIALLMYATIKIRSSVNCEN